MHGDLLITADTECADCVAGLACRRGKEGAVESVGFLLGGEGAGNLRKREVKGEWGEREVVL